MNSSFGDRGASNGATASTVTDSSHWPLAELVQEDFFFSELAQSQRLADPEALAKFSLRTGLRDMRWTAIYNRPVGSDLSLEQVLALADGYVFFIHGWGGSQYIWEDLPHRLAAAHGRIVAFALNVNGFGQSPFIHETPDAEDCSPAALMESVEHWLAALGLWPAARRLRRPFYLFVGHSMGGAALFYKDETGWQDESYGCYALAPALLCNDTQRQSFYKTLGLGIRLPSFEAIKNALAPRIIDILAGGASAAVKAEHLRIFKETPFGTAAQTIYAMGALARLPRLKTIHRHRVALGHADRLVGLNFMLDLLQVLGLESSQIRVTLGDHYFFSYDASSPHTHAQNRELVLSDLLAFCAQLTAEVKSSKVPAAPAYAYKQAPG